MADKTEEAGEQDKDCELSAEGVHQVKSVVRVPVRSFQHKSCCKSAL